MKKIFISSRMIELAIEREIAFTTSLYKGYRPLMFETEPEGAGLRKKINNLIDESDCFIGIYFKTIGRKEKNLFDLTPIEYELAYFICKKCQLNSFGCPNVKQNHNQYMEINKKSSTKEYLEMKEVARIEEDDKEDLKIKLDHMRKLITKHYYKPEKINDFEECLKTIYKEKDNIYLFCKSFDDEHSISSPLHILIDGLTSVGLLHTDFKKEWDLSNHLVKKLIYPDKEYGQDIKKYYVEFQGKDEAGLLNHFAYQAFMHHLNIDSLYINNYNEVNINITKTIAELTDYSQQNKIEVFNKYVKDNIYRVSENDNLKEINTQDVQMEVNNKIEEFESDMLSPKNFKVEYLKNKFIIRVHHLDVPGVIYNITETLRKHSIGSNPAFDIKKFITRVHHHKYYTFCYANKKVHTDINIEFKHFNQDKIQTTDMMIEFQSENNIDKDLAIRLENEINKIIGVSRVLISDVEQYKMIYREKKISRNEQLKDIYMKLKNIYNDYEEQKQ